MTVFGLKHEQSTWIKILKKKLTWDRKSPTENALDGWLFLRFWRYRLVRSFTNHPVSGVFCGSFYNLFLFDKISVQTLTLPSFFGVLSNISSPIDWVLFITRWNSPKISYWKAKNVRKRGGGNDNFKTIPKKPCFTSKFF